MSHRFIHIPSTGGGGGGPILTTAAWPGKVLLEVWQPILGVEPGAVNPSYHNPIYQSWICTWWGNVAGPPAYGEWRATDAASGEQITVRWYDTPDPRGWWWDVPMAARKIHPNGTLCGPLTVPTCGINTGTEIHAGFEGSEDDGDCVDTNNDPVQQYNSVLNYNDSGILGQCTGKRGDMQSYPGGVTDFDPGWCQAPCYGSALDLICYQVAHVNWDSTGSSSPARIPTSNGCRKYHYDCIFNP